MSQVRELLEHFELKVVKRASGAVVIRDAESDEVASGSDRFAACLAGAANAKLPEELRQGLLLIALFDINEESAESLLTEIFGDGDEDEDWVDGDGDTVDEDIDVERE